MKVRFINIIIGSGFKRGFKQLAEKKNGSFSPITENSSSHFFHGQFPKKQNRCTKLDGSTEVLVRAEHWILHQSNIWLKYV